MKKIIADSSVLVKWFTSEKEKYVEKALGVLDDLKKGEIKILTSDLAPHEISNALWKKKQLPLSQAQKSFRILYRLPIKIIKTNAKILTTAYQIARKTKITSYDAVFLALALQNSCPLLTANPKHQQKFEKVEVTPLNKY